MTFGRALVCANTLILLGALAPLVAVAAMWPFPDRRLTLLRGAPEALLAAAAVTLVGTAWSGRIAVRDPQPRAFGSRYLFTLGLFLCLAEPGLAFLIAMIGF
jgi:hypothetical protein